MRLVIEMIALQLLVQLSALALDIPVSLFSGGRDWLADPKDVEKLRADINHTIVYDNTLDRFDHLDFVWGTTAKDRVYKEIILQIRKSEATNDNV